MIAVVALTVAAQALPSTPGVAEGLPRHVVPDDPSSLPNLGDPHTLTIRGVRCASLQDDGGCLVRMRRSPASDVPTFETELECELWETVVRLEGDLRTATIALANAEQARDALAAMPPVIVPVEASPTPTETDSDPWRSLRWGIVAALGASVGGFAGYFVEPSRPWGATAGAPIGAIAAVLIGGEL